MPAALQPDLRAALRLVHDLEDADDAAAIRAAVLADLPRCVRCDAARWADDVVVVERSDPPFGDAELALLELLRPHLLRALRTADERARAAATGLTPREREVLDLVATGAPNRAIAGTLRMRPRTVEKHLEHAYSKLGVRSRTAAVAALREITH